MTENKNLYIYAIPYLMVCSVLYHISYWDIFGLNGLSFISVSDIIKSAVYPIYSTVFIIVMQMTLSNFIDIHPQHLIHGKRFSNEKIYFIGIGVLIFWFLFLELTGFEKNPYRFIITSIIVGIFMSIFLIRSGIFDNIIKTYKLRNFVIDIIVLVPLLSLAAGKYDGENIYRNIKYKYIITANKTDSKTLKKKSETLKLLGLSENHFIFTDIKNTKTFFIKSDRIDTLVIYDKR